MAEADPAANDVTSPPDSGQPLVRDGEGAANKEIDAGRRDLVTSWQKKVKDRRDKLKPEFEKMRANMQFARLGAEKEWVDAGNYVVPITVRAINQKVARLYARNPQVTAEVRRQVLFSVWDGDPQTLESALMIVGPARMAMKQAEMAGDLAGFEMAAQSIDPESAAIVEEVETVKREQLLLQRIADTAEILGNAVFKRKSPNLKKSLKQLIRRTGICKVGYVDVSFERIMQPNPAIVAQIEGNTSQTKAIEAMLEQAAAGEIEALTKEAEELRLALATLRLQEQMIVREGVVLDFPASDEVWSDEETTQLDGFIGANWVVRQWQMKPERVKELFGVDVGDGFTPYFKKQPGARGDGEKGNVCVWRVQDKRLKEEFYIADGYPDFLREPGPPEVSLERFFTVHTLVFNGIESDESLYAPSDVELIMSAAKEINRSRQDLKDHRRAALPRYVAAGSALDKKETTSILDYPAHAIIKLKQLLIGQKVTDLLQPLPLVKPDAALYDTRPQMDDVLRGIGSQDANFGAAGAGDTTATEASIADESRSADQSSNVDEVDELLTELASSINELNLQYMSLETVKEIAGEKAVWPEHNRAEAMKKITLEVKAGSSGRPNAAADLAKMERAVPYMLQIPGASMNPVLNRYSDLLDLPADQMRAEGAPSAVTLNAIMQRMAAPAPANSNGKPSGQRQGGEGDRQPARPAPGEQTVTNQQAA